MRCRLSIERRSRQGIRATWKRSVYEETNGYLHELPDEVGVALRRDEVAADGARVADCGVEAARDEHEVGLVVAQNGHDHRAERGQVLGVAHRHEELVAAVAGRGRRLHRVPRHVHSEAEPVALAALVQRAGTYAQAIRSRAYTVYSSVSVELRSTTSTCKCISTRTCRTGNAKEKVRE